MQKPQTFQPISSSNITHQNLTIVKKFFGFKKSTKNVPQKIPDGIINAVFSKPHASLRSKRSLQIYQSSFSYNNSTHKFYESQKIPNGQLKISSKKIKDHELTSFLLGFNQKIRKQYQNKIKNHQQQTQTVRDKEKQKQPYEQFLGNLTRMNQHHRKQKLKDPLPTLQRKRQSSKLERSIKVQPYKKHNSLQISSPIENRTQASPESPQRFKKYRESLKLKMNECLTNTSTQNIENSNNNSIAEKVFEKGYLAYDLQAKKFHQQYIENMKIQFKESQIQDITASSYIVINSQTLTPIIAKKPKLSIQIASLTKIMTCYLCILACRKYQVDLQNYNIRVSDRAAQMPGTSAELQAGDYISLYQLLFGLMLPSGNDASVAIAETVGKIIQKYKKKPTRKTPYETFITHMNILARELQLQQIFQNSSGLSAFPNESTPQAITLLSAIAIRDPLFMKIINTKEYELQVKNDRFGLTRKLLWKNTNKLLWKGWQGVKTGTTQTAGHCLMTKKGQYLIGVFNCQTLNKRFSQSVKIYETIIKNKASYD